MTSVPLPEISDSSQGQILNKTMNDRAVAKQLALALLASQKKITKSLEGIRVQGGGQDFFIPFSSSSPNNSSSGRGF